MNKRYTIFERLNEEAAVPHMDAVKRKGWVAVSVIPEPNDFALYIVWATRCAAGDHATWAVYGQTNFGRAWMTPARIMLRPSHWMLAEDAFDLKSIEPPSVERTKP